MTRITVMVDDVSYVDDVEVLHGDTQSSHKGMDTYGSRSLTVGGIAVVKAAEKVIAIIDAVRHLGVTDIEMPCSPQRVWRAVQSARAAASNRGGAR